MEYHSTIPAYAGTSGRTILDNVIEGSHTEDSIKQRKDYADLRDRLAYVHIHGSYPTHLRTWFTKLISVATGRSMDPTALDGQGGAIKVMPDVVERLNLEHHPMIITVRQHIRDGYRIARSRHLHTDRRPYSRVFLHRKIKVARGVYDEKKTVYVNGAVRDGWH